MPQLMKYDMVLLACGGVQGATDPTKYAPINPGGGASPISDKAKKNMVAYVNAGGRAFGEHYHWAWIKGFPAPDPTDPFSLPYPPPFGTEVATWIPYTSTTGTAANALIDTSFPKGTAFAQWMLLVKASTALGQLPLTGEVKPTAKDQIKPPSQWA
jgi:hypothetical protein